MLFYSLANWILDSELNDIRDSPTATFNLKFSYIFSLVQTFINGYMCKISGSLVNKPRLFRGLYIEIISGCASGTEKKPEQVVNRRPSTHLKECRNRQQLLDGVGGSRSENCTLDANPSLII